MLTLDAPADAVELYDGGAGSTALAVPRGGSGGGSSATTAASSLRLTPEEGVGVLRLRVDFAPDEVERAGKALIQLLQPMAQ